MSNPNGNLAGKKVAILVADGFEQVEMTEPRKALEEAGAQTDLVSPAKGKVKGWQHTKWGDEFAVDVPLDQANADDFDALLLPGGVHEPRQAAGQPEGGAVRQGVLRRRASRWRPSATAPGR